MDETLDAAASCRIVTWNVNGLKAAARRFGSVQRLLDSLKGDIICLQETKVRHGDLERALALVDGWHSFFSCFRGKTGYSGVATFCRAAVTVPVAASEGLTGCLQPAGAPVLEEGSSDHLEAHLPRERLLQLDAEGRAVVTDHGAFVLFNLYGPALTSEETAEERMTFKLDFYKVLEVQVQRLRQAGREVVVVGDLNISPHPRDTCRPQEVDVSRPDRIWLNRLLQGELVDVFRVFHPSRENAFTCWSTATGARVHNYGSRIDHILATAVQQQAASPCPAWFRMCDIWPEFQGSDHAPVWADIAPEAPMLSSNEPPALCTAHIFKGRQVSLRNWFGSAAAQQQRVEAATGDRAASGLSQAAACLTAASQAADATMQQGVADAPAAPSDAAGDYGGSSWGSAGAGAGGGAAAAAAAAANGTRQQAPAAGKRPASGRQAPAGTGKQAAPSKKARPPGQTSLLAFISRPPAPSALRPQPSPPPPSASHPSLPGPAATACPQPARSGASNSGFSHSYYSAPANTGSMRPDSQSDCSAPNPADSRECGTFMRGPAAIQQQQQPPQPRPQQEQQQPAGGRPPQEPPDPGPPLGPGPALLPPAPDAIHLRAVMPAPQQSEHGIDSGGLPQGLPGDQIVCSQYRCSSTFQPTAPVSFRDAPPALGATTCNGQVDWQRTDPLPSLATAPPSATTLVQTVAAPPSLPFNTHSTSSPALGTSHSTSQDIHTAGALDADTGLSGAVAGIAGTATRVSGAGAGMSDRGSERPSASSRGQPVGVAPPPKEAAADAWRRITEAMKPPCCTGHKEPCAVRTVKKRGPNQGRQFYVCARPDGPPPVGRCDHFEWAGRRGVKKPGG